MQLPIWEPEYTWQATQVNQLPSWKDAKRIGIDIETRDDNLHELGPGTRRGAYITGVSFFIEDHPQSYYLPIRHEGGDNLPVQEVMRYLKDNAANFKGSLVGNNLSYDLDFLIYAGINFPNVEWYRDVQVADALIWELHHRYNLDAIASRHGVVGKDEKILREAAATYGINPKNEMWKLPARYVGEYAAQDAEAPVKILRRQEKLIDTEDLWQIYNLESEVLPVLVQYVQRGVKIDQDQLAKVERFSITEEHKHLDIIKRESGVKLISEDVNKSDALAAPLLAIGAKLNKTAKSGQWQVDSAALKSIDHPVARSILQAKKLNKLRGTFVSSIHRFMTNGRIHCGYHQMKGEAEDEGAEGGGAAYGRLSSRKPNIQQQPARDEFAKMWRSIYVPDNGKLWLCADYSQQEPRLMTHYAELTGCRNATKAANKYRNDPNTDNHTMMTQLIHGDDVINLEKPVFKKHRDNAKQLFLGLCYWMGSAKLARSLGMGTRWCAKSGYGSDSVVKYFATQQEAVEYRRSVPDSVKVYVDEVADAEAQDIMDKFDSNVPYVREMLYKAKARADKIGYITTLYGRHCHFPMKDNGSFDWTYRALNRLIQGSAGDQTKLAMVALEKAGHEMQMQVHDEIDGSIIDESQANEIGEIMTTCITLRVPSKVDLEIGPSWGEIK